MEKTLVNAVTNFFPILFDNLIRNQANHMCVQLRILIARGTFAKPLVAPGLPPVEGVRIGKTTDIKVKELLGIWAKHIDAEAPDLQFGEKTGLIKFFPVKVAPPDDTFAVAQVPVRLTSKTTTLGSSEPSGAAAPASETPASASAGEISLGDAVEVIKRVTLKFPMFDDPDFRKDLRVGTQGKVLEVSKDSKKVKVQAHVMHHGEPAVAFDWVVVTNLRPVKEDTEPPAQRQQACP